MTPENGSTGGFVQLHTRGMNTDIWTEIWLGTHRNTTIADQEGAHGERASGRIKPDLLQAQRALRGPCQPVIKKGSIIVRDLRLWHGGKPNYSTEPRVMLAMSKFTVLTSRLFTDTNESTSRRGIEIRWMSSSPKSLKSSLKSSAQVSKRLQLTSRKTSSSRTTSVDHMEMRITSTRPKRSGACSSLAKLNCDYCHNPRTG